MSLPKPKVVRSSRAGGRPADGANWTLIGSELAMNYETVRRWCIEKRASKMRRVEVVPAPSEANSPIAIVSPSGFRAEGLTVRDTVMILPTLR